MGFLIFSLNLSSTAQEQPTSLICQSQLNSKIEQIVNRSQFKRFRWGIAITTLSDEDEIYSRDAEYYFIPASTTKLMTTAAALSKLTPNYRIPTLVYGDANQNLYILGQGDPSLTTTQLQDLTQQLKNQGITQVNQLIADERYFPGFSVHPTWEWEIYKLDMAHRSIV
ncbi:MAG: D-alanyl-D-alanine carboxypeptidase [Cyanobacteriota bacterium]|nr:D-alanyl-D-alanine carboxypeptidase [Cyanobacteriota bacterium]